MLETSNQLKTNKVDVANIREPTTMKPNDEIPLPGLNINASTKPVTKVTTLSRATQDENHVVPVFGTGKYSATLSTTAFGL